MKLAEAMDVIGRPEVQKSGFMVSFERREGNILCGDHFPDKHAGETLIQDEQTAWMLASLFARKMGADRIASVYVVGANFVPVAGYRERMIFPLHAPTDTDGGVTK